MMYKERKWWVAGLLSLLQPGLGQIYNGQGRKGFIFLLCPFLFLPAFIFCLDHDSIRLFITACFLVILAYYIIAIGHAIYSAHKRGPVYKLKKYNKFIVYLGILAFVIVVNTALTGFVRNSYVQAYKIPSASNQPTLLIGDHILADKRQASRDPRLGDLIVFEFPQDPTKDFIKRVVAVGNDTVEIRDKLLLINDEPIIEEYIVHNDERIIPAKFSPRDNFGPIVVPEGHFFVLGDNRDHSMDSRFWGVLNKTKIKGTAKSIYWSWDRDEKSVRWGRIGPIVP